MGYNIGTRLVDEFMARSGAGRCQSFEETAEVLARTAFKMFLGTAAAVNPNSTPPFSPRPGVLTLLFQAGARTRPVLR